VLEMVIDYNGCMNLVTAKQNAEIVKMVSENVISSKQAKDLLTIIIDENKKQIEDFVKCGDYGQKL
jgi:Asp-tRNA(Asn)/Glu-tRNA(Gln) amidotransferase B subunit